MSKLSAWAKKHPKAAKVAGAAVGGWFGGMGGAVAGSNLAGHPEWPRKWGDEAEEQIDEWGGKVVRAREEDAQRKRLWRRASSISNRLMLVINPLTSPRFTSRPFLPSWINQTPASP